jgi:putative nucleotidyltransferase with HDIG domain
MLLIAVTSLVLIAGTLVEWANTPAALNLHAAVNLFIGIPMFFLVILVSALSDSHDKFNKHFKSMQNIDRVMLTGLSQNSVIQSIKDTLTENLQSDAAGFYMIDKYKGGLKVISNHNLDMEFHKRITSPDSDIQNMLLNARQPVVFQVDKTSNVGFAQLMMNEAFSTCLFAPIIARGVQVGLLLICNHRTRVFTKRETEFIKSMSYQMAIAWEKWQIVNRIAEMNFESVLALVQAIEMRDPYTKGHSLQVANLSMEIARRLEFSERRIELVQYAGLLHDVGKIAVPEAILKKPSKLDSTEWAIMKKHPLHSAKAIEPIRDLQEIHGWILYHHERWDGGGYPEGIKGERIPLEARILAVSDTYSAMIGDRPYRSGLLEDDIRKEIRDYAATQFDPAVAKVFLSIDGEILKDVIKSEGGKRL